MKTNLPIFSIALEHHGILRLANIAVIVIFHLLGAFLCLDPIVLGEGALVPGTAGVCQEVRADRLKASLCGGSDLAE